MVQKIRTNFHKILDYGSGSLCEFALSLKNGAYLQLTKVAILKKSRKLVNRLNTWVKIINGHILWIDNCENFRSINYPACRIMSPDLLKVSR